MAKKRTANRNGSNGNGRGTPARAAASRIGGGAVESADRLAVLKTYKIYIGGKFPRTESGRYYRLRNREGKPLANICDCSRKDFRDAVVAARNAQSSWASRAAYNRGQILYRIAEMLEGRSPQFVEELISQGESAPAARSEVAASIDRWVYYAGWADKYQQIFSSVNPVSSSHFNFSMLEPTGVASVLCNEAHSLLGLVSVIAPIIAGGNTAIALASTGKPLCAVTFAEVLATSDLPGGVVNILTGHRKELLDHFASHMDVNAVVYCDGDAKELASLRTKAAENVKRVVVRSADPTMDDAANPYAILDTQEVKTTWHPVGI